MRNTLQEMRGSLTSNIGIGILPLIIHMRPCRKDTPRRTYISQYESYHTVSRTLGAGVTFTSEKVDCGPGDVDSLDDDPEPV